MGCYKFMKIDVRVFALSIVLGIALVLLDILLGSPILDELGVNFAFAEGHKGHERFMRSLILITFLVFGLLISRQLYIRRQAEKQAAEMSVFLRQLIDAIPAPVFYKDRHYVYTGCNKSFETYLGRPAVEIVGRTVYQLAPEHLAEVYHAKDAELMANPGVQIYESKVKGGTAEERNVVFHKATYQDGKGEVAGMIGIILDITELRQAEAAQQALIAELREALNKVKVLTGFLPVCATCKKIRNDSGYWQQIDAYIREHTEAVVSHSICPDCSKKLFAEYEAEQQQKQD